MNDRIRSVMSRLSKDKICSSEATASLSRVCTREELAEFIVEAFDRGWVTNFNVGLDSDGDPI